MNEQRESSSPRSAIVLVPGHWLGGWAWDAVRDELAARGHPVTAVTLPGVGDTAAATVSFQDQVAEVLTALRSRGEAGVLVVHSGAGAIASAITDTAPEAVRRVVYVDSGPVADGTVPRPGLPDAATTVPFPGMGAFPEQLTAGLDDETRARITARATSMPAGPLRAPVMLRHPERNDVPATMVCCSVRAATVGELAAASDPMFAPTRELTDLDFVDLPTGHWPMFSRPAELAAILSREALRD